MQGKKNLFSKMAMMLCILFLSHPIFGYEKEIQELSLNLSRDFITSGINRLAVVDFTNLKGEVTELGRFMAEEISVALLTSKGKFEIVDRIHLKSLLKEHKLSQKGLMDPSTSRKLGKIAGVDALITGSITPFGNTVRVTVKTIDIESARIINAQKTNIAATDAIKGLMEEGIETTVKNYTQPKANNVKPSSIKRTIQKSIKDTGIRFDFQKCVGKSNSIECHYLITALEKDLSFQIDFNSGIFDQDSNGYYPKKIIFGNRVLNSSDLVKLYSKIPNKVILKFNDINTTLPKTLSLMTLKFRSGSKGSAIKFNDVVLIK